MRFFDAKVVALLVLVGASMSAQAQSLTSAKLTAWLSSYGDAWEMRDPDRAAALFTENARYHEMPFDEPKMGRQGIREYWATVTADQRDVQFDSQVLAVEGNRGVAHWSAKFRSQSTGATLELDGVFVLEFDANGLCSSLREWWHLRE
jgi:nuclear transport factor 2 (NTF2) superfamily protein